MEVRTARIHKSQIIKVSEKKNKNSIRQSQDGHQIFPFVPLDYCEDAKSRVLLMFVFKAILKPHNILNATNLCWIFSKYLEAK